MSRTARDVYSAQARAIVDEALSSAMKDMVHSGYAEYADRTTHVQNATRRLARTVVEEVLFNAIRHMAGSDYRPKMTDSDSYADEAKSLVDDVVSGAKEMVDDVIANAFRRLETRMSEREKTCESLKTGRLSAENTFISRDENFEMKDIGWMTIQEFSVEKAEQKINEFIKTWEYEESWQYCVDFLGEDTHPYDRRYRFRVRWSIPTRRKPVPRATASVYFTFVVSTIKPGSYPVDVFYVFETNRLVHKPGQSRFREKWLKDIIETKVTMMAAVRF